MLNVDELRIAQQMEDQFPLPSLGAAEKIGSVVLKPFGRIAMVVLMSCLLSAFLMLVVEGPAVIIVLASLGLAVPMSVGKVPEIAVGVPKFLGFVPIRDVELKTGLHLIPLCGIKVFSLKPEPMRFPDIGVLTGSSGGTEGVNFGGKTDKEGKMLDVTYRYGIPAIRIREGGAYRFLWFAEGKITSAIIMIGEQSVRSIASQYVNPEAALFAHNKVGTKLLEHLRAFAWVFGLECPPAGDLNPILDIEPTTDDAKAAVEAGAIAEFEGKGVRAMQRKIKETLEESRLENVPLEKQAEMLYIRSMPEGKISKQITDTRLDIGETAAKTIAQIAEAIAKAMSSSGKKACIT